jgi:hypothetical protein
VARDTEVDIFNKQSSKVFEMLSEEVFFGYFWQASGYLGFQPKRLQLSRKICALLMFLMYIFNTVLSTMTSVTSASKSSRRVGIEFLPISFVKVSEMLYVTIKSEEIRSVMDNWNEVMLSSAESAHFKKGRHSAMRIIKMLLAHMTLISLAHPIRLLVTGSSSFPITMPDNFLGFTALWIFQSWFVIYGASVSFILDVLIFYNFFMFESYAKITSDLMKQPSIKDVHGSYMKFML